MMWLKYTGVVPAVLPVQRQFGPYVPVSVMTGYRAEDPPLYWRLDDPKFNLVEIGIDRRDGHFVSLTVTFYNGTVQALSRAEDAPAGGDINGLPLFSLDPWAAAFAPERDIYDMRAEFYDVPGRCRIEMGGDTVRVVLSADEIHRRVVTRGELVSEFNSSGELCAISLLKLSPQEKRMLEESLMGAGAQ